MKECMDGVEQGTVGWMDSQGSAWIVRRLLRSRARPAARPEQANGRLPSCLDTRLGGFYSAGSHGSTWGR